ncbi:MAG TPA: alpha/beta fold hydrolase [Nevskiaceae bacterium]|nr:alpha/beta fold hydrolase [Nevskiaceae bacterium]
MHRISTSPLGGKGQPSCPAQSMRLRGYVLLAAALLLAGCSGSDLSNSAPAPAVTSSDAAMPAGTNPDWGANPPPVFAGDPAFDVAQAKLDKNLLCTGFSHVDKSPILLVHGTFTQGPEQYDWSYVPLLDELGYDVCVVTYPDRGLGDQQVSAEYVANAMHRIYQKTGRKIAMIGHSQGATMPRWAIKFWPSLQREISVFVEQAGPNHGLKLLGILPPGDAPLEPAGFYQFDPSSNFVKALNAGNEAPGPIQYTTLYSYTDELIQPALPVPTAAIDWAPNNPPTHSSAANVTNINLQQVCPGHIVDHVTIGTTDPLAFALTMDAITHDSPANFQRAGGSKLCLQTAIPLPNLGPLLKPSTGAAALVAILKGEAAYGLPSGLDLVTEEPPLKAYAQGALPKP